jgi:hypothetical protein
MAMEVRTAGRLKKHPSFECGVAVKKVVANDKKIGQNREDAEVKAIASATDLPFARDWLRVM